VGTQKVAYLNECALCSLNLEEVTGFFKRTVSSHASVDQQQKLDDRLQPVPSEVYGSVLRTNEKLLKHYEDIGNKIYKILFNFKTTKSFFK